MLPLIVPYLLYLQEAGSVHMVEVLKFVYHQRHKVRLLTVPLHSQRCLMRHIFFPQFLDLILHIKELLNLFIMFI